MIKACIFDLDGTLLYTISNITYHINSTLEKYGVEGVDEKTCISLLGKGARNLLERIFDRRGVLAPSLRDEMFDAFLKAYNADPNCLVSPYEGIPELIDELISRGVKLAVVSNKPHPATISSIDLFFGGKFDLVLGSREDVPLKPAPDSCREVFAAFSVTPDEVMFIGDSEVDVYTARNISAGKGVAVTWGYRTREELAASGAELFADTPAQILELL